MADMQIQKDYPRGLDFEKNQKNMLKINMEEEVFLYNSSFSKLSKYKENDNQTQLENFTTELFVFVLKYLINKNDPIVKNILHIFEFEKNIKMNKINIDTQKIFTVKKGKINKEVKPDIVIEYFGELTIIEVKIDAKLNNYYFENKTYDQIELYNKIDVPKKVFLLTKKVTIAKNLSSERRKLWSNIHELLKSSDDFIIKDFLLFLEENEMGSTKIKKETLKLLETYNSLQQLIKDSWRYDDKYKLSTFEVAKQWMGAYIKPTVGRKKNENLFWIGQYPKNSPVGKIYPDSLVFQIQDYSLWNKIHNENPDVIHDIDDKGDFGIVSHIKIEDLINMNDGGKQKERLTEWFIEIMENKLKCIKQKKRRIKNG